MTARLLPPSARSGLLAARSVPAWRALVEAGAGYAILGLAAAATYRALGSTVSLHLVSVLLAFGWLVIWPAWRLNALTGRWLTRMAQGTIRALLLGVALALMGSVLSRLPPWPWSPLPLPGTTIAIVAGFLGTRALFSAGVAVFDRTTRRLRWQLMASHVGVIMLIVVTLTSSGTAIGLALLLRGITPNVHSMAQSVAGDLRLARALTPFDRNRANVVLKQIYKETLPLRGEPALAGIAPSPLLPNFVGVTDLSGHILIGRVLLGDRRSRRARGAADLGLTPGRWRTLRSQALVGRTATVTLPAQQAGDSSSTMAESPIRNARGRIDAMVVLRVSDPQPTSSRFFRVIVAVFGLTTVALSLLISIPMLGASFLFSYLTARGITRRLEAVSEVARAIAAGNLRARAPLAARNEVGQLAKDVNRMAEHLETTMVALQQARTEALEALRLRQELVANISHELRTPLAIVRAHLETLSMQEQDDVPAMPLAHRERLEVPAATVRALQAETERLSSMVDDLFSLSRAQTGTVLVRAERVRVGDIIAEIVAVMSPLARQDGAISLSEATPSGPVDAIADADRLRQILSNLVRNAIRHTPPGGIIVLSAQQQGSWIAISIADTGEGISAEHLPHIFERFYRIDPARTRNSGGAGLGLAIVREFVELMGGQIEVQSSPGEGSCFRILLPAAEAIPVQPGVGPGADRRSQS